MIFLYSFLSLFKSPIITVYSLRKINVIKKLDQNILDAVQIIKHSDLEELQELGSGTFGTVYHGKWRGTDVAIKRIKKSCFSGRSSEQERLVSCLQFQISLAFPSPIRLVSLYVFFSLTHLEKEEQDLFISMFHSFSMTSPCLE